MDENVWRIGEFWAPLPTDPRFAVEAEAIDAAVLKSRGQGEIVCVWSGDNAKYLVADGQIFRS